MRMVELQVEELSNYAGILLGGKEPSPIAERIVRASPLDRETQESIFEAIAHAVEPQGTASQYYICQVYDVADKRRLLGSLETEARKSSDTAFIAVTPDTYERIEKAGNVLGKPGKPIPAEHLPMIKALLFLRQELTRHTSIMERYLERYCRRVQEYMTEKDTHVADVIFRIQEEFGADSKLYPREYSDHAMALREAAVIGSDILSEVTLFFEGRQDAAKKEEEAGASVMGDVLLGELAPGAFYVDSEKKIIRLPLEGHMEKREASESRAVIESLILDGTAFGVYQTAGTPFLPETISVAGQAYVLQKRVDSEEGGGIAEIVYRPAGSAVLPDITFMATGKVIDSITIGYTSTYEQGSVTRQEHTFTLFGSLIGEGIQTSIPNTYRVRIGDKVPSEITVYHRTLHNEGYPPPADVERMGGRQWIRVFAGDDDAMSYAVLPDAYPDGAVRIVSVDHHLRVVKEIPALIDQYMQFARGVQIVDYTSAYYRSMNLYTRSIEADGLFWGREEQIIEDGESEKNIQAVMKILDSRYGSEIRRLADTLTGEQDAEFSVRLIPVKDTALFSEFGIGEVTMSIDPKRGRASLSLGAIGGVVRDVSCMVWNGVSSPNKLRSEFSPDLTARIVSALRNSWENGNLADSTRQRMFSLERDPARKKAKKLKDRAKKGKLTSLDEMVFLYRRALTEENIVRSSE